MFQHYVDLNVPFVDSNTAYLEGKEDYLAAMSSPDHETLSSPTMRSSSTLGFTPESSPTKEATDGKISYFDFPLAPRIGQSTDVLTPDDEDDDNYLRPIDVHKKRAEFVRQQEAEKKDRESMSKRDSGFCNARIDSTNDSDTKRNSIETPTIEMLDNYVNVPRKVLMDATDSFTNPSYVFVKNNLSST